MTNQRRDYGLKKRRRDGSDEDVGALFRADSTETKVAAAEQTGTLGLAAICPGYSRPQSERDSDEWWVVALLVLVEGFSVKQPATGTTACSPL